MVKPLKTIKKPFKTNPEQFKNEFCLNGRNL